MFNICLIIKVACVIIGVIHVSHSLESPEREVVLQPRNFNPHPYREGHRHGPVLFPGNPSDGRSNHRQAYHQQLQKRPHLQLRGQEQDEHPYANVARKQRLRLNGPASEEAVDQENNINPRVYSGLANYAAKVLKKPNGAQHNGYPDPSLAAEKKNYAFSYAVRDHATGDDFSHSQSQDAKATNGEYRVKLPDGRIQTVSYTADKNGYKADVKYSDGTETQSVAPLVVASSTEDNNYEYYDEPRSQVEHPIYNNGHSDNYESKYQPNYVTIYPKLDGKVGAHYVLPDRVHLYHTGTHKLVQPEKINVYAGPTEQELQPQLYQHGYEHNHYSPGAPHPHANHFSSGDQHYGAYSTSAPHRYDGFSTVAPQVQYSPVYITTPRYSVAPHGGFQHNYYKR